MQVTLTKPECHISVVSNTYIHANTYIDNVRVCRAKISTNDNYDEWTITAWYTDKEYQKKGIGKYTLKKLLQALYKIYGEPQKINYIWNGQNDYVLDWMTKHFDATNGYPTPILKYSPEDVWLSHIYTLDVKKVMEYFEVKSLY